MTAERFEEVFNEQMDYCRELLIQKSKEYAIKNPDRLQHFKRTAGFLKTTPEDALIGMLSKHLISVVDMCRDPELERYPLEQWTEKITDTINYLLLLKGIVVERLTPQLNGLSEFVDQNLPRKNKELDHRKAMDQVIEEKIESRGPEEAWNPGRDMHEGLLPIQQMTIEKIKAEATDESNRVAKPVKKDLESPIVSEGVPDEKFIPDAECLRSLETYDNIGNEEKVVKAPGMVVLDAAQIQPRARKRGAINTEVNNG